MGHTLQLHFVKRIENPNNHDFQLDSEHKEWDYVDLNDEFDLYSISNGDMMDFYAKKIEQKKWPSNAIDFLIKTDGRFYGGDEAYEPILFSPEYILSFILLIEKDILNTEKKRGGVSEYFKREEKAEQYITSEIQEMKRRCEIALEKAYSLKCLDR
jgi:hypothetical protein